MNAVQLPIDKTL